MQKTEIKENIFIEEVNKNFIEFGVEQTLELFMFISYGILVLYLKKLIKGVNKNNRLIESFKIEKKLRFTEEENKEIHRILNLILKKSESNRVLMCFYHNGQALFNKYAFVKFSACYEVVEEGKEKISNIYKDVPVTLLDFENKCLELEEKDKKINLKILNKENNHDSIFWIKDIHSYLIAEIKGKNIFENKKGFILMTYDQDNLIENKLSKIVEIKKEILELERLI